MEAVDTTTLETASPPSTSTLDAVLGALRAAVASPAFLPALAVTASLCVLFWPLLLQLPTLWNGPDGYYSHGPIVPLISAFILYKWWPRIKDTPAKFGVMGIPFLLILLVVMYPATVSRIDGLLSLGMIATAISAVWVIAGFRWMLISIAPIGYLAFCLPLWSAIVNNTTNPLQVISTKVAYELLRLSGFFVYQSDPTVIYMNNFQLNVEVPCSGLKLLLALVAFTVFFVLIARLKWWANMIALALIPVLAILINGLRIALIGVVGETYGRDAGLKFHDYSGYITLIVCFVVLFKIFRLMGWKD
ncbi:MAG: exosortase/archaeosortase family protein [Methanoregulaceae archaeon]|nr:exosortase/archaeosortase family protein [Methanoregulaceae archaeon]